MMVGIKEKLVSQINATEDELLLKQISILLSDDNSTIYTLTTEEKEAIKIGLNDINNGRTISNEDIQKEWDSWL